MPPNPLPVGPALDAEVLTQPEYDELCRWAYEHCPFAQPPYCTNCGGHEHLCRATLAATDARRTEDR